MEKKIEKDFIERTIHILENYKGPYGVTLLINCLLGLIVLPKEKDFEQKTGRNGICFCDLGIRAEDITSWGNILEEDRTAARFLRCMRNSVAHIKIESITHNGEIESLRFCDNSGFEVVFPIERLKEMVMNLADHITHD